MALAQLDPGTRFFEEAMNRMLNEPRAGRPWSPPVDIFETEDELVLKADVPDINVDDIDVRVENETLTIKGERKFEQHQANKAFHRIERSYGTFVRSFSVPATVKTEAVKAEYKNGILTVTLPKKEAAKPRQVKVESK